MSALESAERRLHTLLLQILDPPVTKVANWDGYWFRFGSAPILVTVVESEEGVPLVKVASPFVADTPKTPELLDLLNDMNGGMEVGRAYWMNGKVWAAQTLL